MNPVAEEPRVVRERPVVVEPRTLSSMEVEKPAANAPFVLTPTNERTRIYGPSILGIGGGDDAPSSDSDYLLDDEPVERSTWRGWALLAVLLVFAFLAYKQFGQGKSVKELFAQAIPQQQQKTQEPVVSETNNTANANKPADANASQTGDSAKTETAKNEPMQKPENDAAVGIPHEPNGDKDHETRASEGKPAQEIDDAPEASEEKPSAKKETAKSAAKEPPAEKPDLATVELAQKYIQGRGVPQDCNRGFQLLRSATEKPNPRAHIQLGALYASGTCVEQDRAQAYHHFAAAQSLDPKNTWIERNLNALWREMTPAERERAQRH